MSRFICIHGHFYQPPRENPWLEDIELQDSAHPFHDWNDRIHAECYRANATSRVLDGRGLIVDIVNNYEKMSFNFGPTLLSWMEKHRSEAYGAILEADRRSRERFSGHGSALAQAYNHLILPLANRRDKLTQIRWGIRDFSHRFGRAPEGMWLPETAVDLETLELLAAEGVRFTLLAPNQARAVREVGSGTWKDVSGGRIDPRRPYLCRLPSGAGFPLFFYDGVIAQGVAFGGLLENGQRFAEKLHGALLDHPQPQLIHVATDGESYGHHHRFGDMALAYCLREIEAHQAADLTVYGEYLEKYPPTHEVEIFENSSWSCAHGVERWRSDCGCNSGRPGWHQGWREPLREALDWLRDRLIPLYEQGMGELGADPWQARDDYIGVILDRSPQNQERFFQAACRRDLAPEEKLRLLRLLEMQRHAMLMYTSCGWFFDEVSGIETVQVMAYAGRALQLAEEACGAELEEAFVERLEKAPSNVPAIGNAGGAYRKYVVPTRLDLIRVAVHHVITTLFEGNHEPRQVYSYLAENPEYDIYRSGRLSLAVGRTFIRSGITGNKGDFSFAVLHLSGNSLNAGAREYRGEEALAAMRKELRGAFEKGDLSEVIRLMDRHFGHHNYTLRHLFRDEQRKILDQVLQQPLEEVEEIYQRIYENQFPLLQFLREIDIPAPKALVAPVEFIMNARLEELFGRERLDLEELKNLGEELARVEVSLDQSTLGQSAGRQIARHLEALRWNPRDPALLAPLIEALELLHGLPLEMELWEAQNILSTICKEQEEAIEAGKKGENEPLRQWLEQFRRLALNLKVGMV